MIHCQLNDLENHLKPTHIWKSVVNFLKNEGSKTREPGKFDIEGTDIFGFAQEYHTLTDDDNMRYEAHRAYVDAQYVVEGTETLKLTDLKNLTITQEYKKDGDCLLGVANEHYKNVSFATGQVMVLYPNDAHAPGIKTAEGSAKVKKLVLKIPVSQV